MNIILQTNASPKNALTKELTDVRTVSAVLKDETTVTDPVFVLGGLLPGEVADINYVTVTTLHRSYFVTGVRSIRNNVWEISCHVDVLSTYAEEIKTQTAVVHRQENAWNLYLDDGIFKTYQNPHIVTKLFPSGFTTQSFVLAIAGGAQNIQPQAGE